jgi:hypothetical protein
MKTHVEATTVNSLDLFPTIHQHSGKAESTWYWCRGYKGERQNNFCLWISNKNKFCFALCYSRKNNVWLKFSATFVYRLFG